MLLDLLKDSFITYKSCCRRICTPKETIENLSKNKFLTNTIMSGLIIKRIDDNDILGIPIFRAISKDTKYMSWGKGSTEDEAKASAMMELIEKYSMNNYNKILLKRAKFKDILNAISRNEFPLTNKQKELYTPKEINEKEINWIKGFSLTNNKEVYLPANLAIINDLNLPNDIIDNNGLGAGNSKEEAILHALCEVIERHLETVIFYNKIKTKKVNLTTIQNKELKKLIDKFKNKGFEIYVNDYTYNLGIPSMSTFIYRKKEYSEINEDEMYNLPFIRTGTSTDPEIAMIRALTEIAQVRSLFLYRLKSQDIKTIKAFDRHLETCQQELKLRRNSEEIPLNNVQNISKDNIKEEINTIINLLAKNDCEVFICDLTNKRVNIPVVRIIIKGLQPLLNDDWALNHPMSRISKHITLKNNKKRIS